MWPFLNDGKRCAVMQGDVTHTYRELQQRKMIIRLSRVALKSTARVPGSNQSDSRH